jgi:hypothetical protein
MNLYIPEIGDHICLTADWKFTLHPESRNTDLGLAFGYYLHSSWIEEALHPRIREIDYSVNYPTDDELRQRFGSGSFFNRGHVSYENSQKAQREAEEACPEFVKYWKDYRAWSDTCDEIGNDNLTVTLPAGTILAVDRIYIRKGASDFSSITFYAKELGEIIRPASRWSTVKKSKKIKALRFWAKLADCNTIEFEKHEKI